MIWRCDLTAQYEAYRDEIQAAIERVLRSGRYVLGENVKAFEAEFSEYLGVGYGVGVNSGTDALMMALWCLDMQPGDEVITTAFTAIPTYSAIRHLRATPVLVDIDPETYLIDLGQVAAAVTPRTRAVVPVHLFGNAVDLEGLREIVGPKVFIVEDCAQAHGAAVRGRKVGSLADLAAFSFYPTKNLGGYGDGGMVVTNNLEMADKLRLRRMYGMINKDEFVTDGINTRLDELQAAVLRVKLRHLDEMNERRRDLAALYHRLLEPFGLQPQAVRNGIDAVWHVYCPLCPDRRDDLVTYMDRCQIQTNVYYPMPLARQEGYRRAYRPTLSFPAAERVSSRIIALPFYPELPKKTLHAVAQTIRDFYAQHTGGRRD